MKLALDRRYGIVALFALAALALGLFAPSTLNDGDTWWHVKVGQWILAHGQAPSVDIWSATRHGQAWTAHEWLSEAIMALAFRAGGWPGVVALCGVAFGLAIWVLGKTVARWMEGTALAVVLLLGMSLMTPSLLARPHVLALPLVTLWASELVRARADQRMPSLWLAPLMTLWANMHGGWAFGLALAGPFGLEALATAEPSKRLSVFLRWAVFGTVCLAAAAITPFGIEGLLLPFRLLGTKNLGGIGEWQPASFGQMEPLEVVLLVLVAFALTKPIKLAPAMTVLLAILIHLSLNQGRHQMLLGMVAPMVLAGPIAAALGEAQVKTVLGRGTAAFTAIAALILVGLRLGTPLPRVDNAASPIAALAAVPAELRAKPVLNEYGLGGYLIWSGIKPFIDSRAELYKDEGLGQYAELTSGNEAEIDKVLRSQNIRWTIFAPEEAINSVLARKPGWRRFYGDTFAVVYVRER